MVFISHRIDELNTVLNRALWLDLGRIVKDEKSPLFLSLFISSLLLCSCGKEITLSAEAPKWDVQTCDRCKMLVSDKKFSAQVVNPTDGKHFSSTTWAAH